MDFHMISGGSTDHRHQHGLWQSQGPWTSTWVPAKTRTMNANMAYCSGMDYRDLLRRLNYLEPEWSCDWIVSLGAEPPLAPGYCNHPSSPTWHQHAPWSTIPICCHIPVSSSIFSITHSSPICSLSLSHIHLLKCKIHYCKLLCVTHYVVYITQTALHANIYFNQSLVLFKVSGNTGLLLISNFLLPSHGDLVAGQHLWEQDTQGLQAAAHWHGMTILISSPAEQVFWAAAATTLMTGLYSAMMLLWPKQQCFHTCLLWVLHPTVVSGCHRLESSDLTGSWG